MTGPRARLRAAAHSDVGPYRSVNQDAAFTAPWGAAVADGVGGGPAGDLASAALVHAIAASRPDGVEAEHLQTIVRLANWDLGAHVKRDPSLTGMATTLTGLFISDHGDLLLAHTGDSRAYRLREGLLEQQSRDDSLVQALVDQGIVTIEDAAAHPRRNVITASLSGAERDAATVVVKEAVVGDRWLLCSDGLTDYVPVDDICARLREHDDPAAAAAACVGLALEAGTRDNVTAVVCDVVAPTSLGGGRPQVLFYGAAAERFMEELDSA
ncbi:PP2C family protein-serine/threonine phosphatase [Microbacterium kyungheense]|uniref:Protein phosphatase n=1 Tax=Microbacterium kyungheense TaxID=1263636 RepID=A0A543FMR3_9MICO|nr:protein phosphatase 2C domain-containing protein [Microbacterium kyungheense]TQM34954.1 protein phosphatase [Microbacterium kyungheense]